MRVYGFESGFFPSLMHQYASMESIEPARILNFMSFQRHNCHADLCTSWSASGRDDLSALGSSFDGC